MASAKRAKNTSGLKLLATYGKESLEQATPMEVTVYRVTRISKSILKARSNALILKTGDGRPEQSNFEIAVDLCCGIGMDAIALAKEFEKVYAFDTGGKAIECARKNAEAFGTKNIEFECKDCFEVNLRAMKPDIVFADPSRRINGMRVKALDETIPSTIKLIEFIKAQGIRD